MHGELHYNNTSKDIFNLNLLDLITQFKNIGKVDFTKADEVDNDYIDLIITIYNEAILDSYYPGNEEITALLPIFIKNLKDLVQNPEKVEKFKSLGATDLDIALINAASQSVQKITDDNQETNIYALAKKYRFLDFALEKTSFDYSLTFKINGKDIPLYSLFDNVFTENNDKNEKNLAFIIRDIGDRTWDYNYNNYEYKNLHPLFNKIMMYGTGSKCLLPEKISKILQQQTENIRAQKLDFVLIEINGHDSKDKGTLQKVISCFPDSLAKETLYIVRSCYSGQYHEIWEKENKNAILITSTSKDEGAYYDAYNTKKLKEFFAKEKMSIKKFVEFLSEYERSVPHISGNYNDKLISYMPVKDFYHQQLNSSTLETSLSNLTELEMNLNGITDENIDYI